MTWRREVAKFGALFRRQKPGDDLEEEIRSHLEMEEQDNLESGMAPDEAHYAALRRFGNVTLAQERSREMWGWNSLETLWQDLRCGARVMAKNPGFTAVVLLILALGIGANSALFSFADTILLRPLPVARPSEVLTVSNATPEKPFEGVSYLDYCDLRASNHSFSGLVAFRSFDLGIGTSPADPPRMRLGMMVSDNFFRVLGIQPSVGRTFLPEEGRVASRDRIAILGYSFWQAQYGASRSVLGRPIRLNGIAFTIVGVAPEAFPGMELFFPPSVYVPLSMWGKLAGGSADPLEDRGIHELSVKGRLKPGVSLRGAQAEFAALGENLEQAYPKTNQNRRVAVETEFRGRVEKEPFRLALVVTLMALGTLLLIITCANVASLALARAQARSREMAIRLAIGAGRSSLIRQLLTESLLTALLGGLAGLALAYGGIRILDSIQVPSDIPFVLGIKLDARALVFALITALGSCLLFGLVPALQATRVRLVPALKAAGEGISTRRRLIGRNVLVIAQVALSLVLLVVTGVLVNGFRKMLDVNPGFDAGLLISVSFDPTVLLYTPGQSSRFYHQLLDKARSLPGVESVTLAQSVPLAPDQSTVTVVPEGYQFPNGRESATVLGGAVDENYFSTVKISVVHGRAFRAADQAGSHRVAMVNEEFAKTYWPGQDAVGKQLRLEGPDGPPAEVVGVAKTAHYFFLWESPTPYVYLPYDQNRQSKMALIAKSQGNPAALAGPFRDLVRSLDSDMPFYNLRTGESYVKWGVNSWLVLVQIVATMGLVGLLLSMVGLYGLISYSVSRRTSEIGLRMAVGASQSDVFRLVIRQGLIIASLGIAMGGALTVTAYPVLAAGLVGLQAVNAVPILAVPLAMIAVSALACYLPARRAAKVDPLVALRYE